VFVVADTESASCGVTFAIGTEQLIYGFTVAEDYNLRGVRKEITPYYATGLCQRHQQLRYVKSSELRRLRQLAKKA